MPWLIMPREATFSTISLTQYATWVATQPRVARKIIELIEECCRTPFEGKGKPEALKGNYSGYWSRRITDEHRLIYKVDNQIVYILSCHGHYA
ncbi:Txe/YoeB family addiction module toxin [Larkinella sp. VNQ87]|uniref:Txe/YoeB family addiction module toxin n=1 Tax=Larkinella sp. VNQ87 TaxID=3400921 RepID=UPI003BFD37AB